jgi:predicted nucleic-acid-binding Zn-ribbon protein
MNKIYLNYIEYYHCFLIFHKGSYPSKSRLKLINVDWHYFPGREIMGKCPECEADDWDDGELAITTPMLLGAKTTYMLNFESNKKRKKIKAKQCKNCNHINLYA